MRAFYGRLGQTLSPTAKRGNEPLAGKRMHRVNLKGVGGGADEWGKMAMATALDFESRSSSHQRK